MRLNSIRRLAKEMIAVYVILRIAQKLRIAEQYSKCAKADLIPEMRIASATLYW
jgi:hypothetical protein